MNIEGTWTVGIISTSNDLANERELLRSFLENNSFEVIAFEGPNFPFNMLKEKNEACLEAFDHIDIGIIVIGNELGYSENNVSITQREYEHIVNIGKYRYVFVKNTVWENYQNSDAKKTVKSAPFIDYINNNGGFITPYNNMEHLKKLLEGRLQDLSVTLVKTLANSQYSKLINSKVISLMDISVNDLVNHNFIEPTLEPKVDTDGNHLDVSNLYKIITNNIITKHILIRGDIGSGKSTFLYAIYVKHYLEFNNGNESKIPLFLSLRGKNIDYSLEKYFCDCFERDLGMSIYPLFKLKRKSYVLYLDGLDEMSDIKTSYDISSFYKTDFFKDLVIVSCRTNYYEAYVRDSHLSEELDLNILVSNWSKKQIIKYINKVFSENEKKIRTYVYNWLKNNFDDWMQTPLMVSVVCFLLKGLSKRKGVKDILSKIVNERTLMTQYTNAFIKREFARHEPDNRFENQNLETIYLKLKEIAWVLYQQKSSSNYKLLEKIENRGSLDYEIATSYFGVTCFEGYYTYTAHEYYLDFMVSLYIFDKMKDSTNVDINYFNYMLSANINKLIFQGINECDECQKGIISDNLFREYTDALTLEPNNIIKRSHIVYYLSRIDLEQNKKKLKIILHEQEKEVEIMLSICFGMVKLGDLEEEEFLYNSVETNVEWDETNRGYHLLYYKDIEKHSVPYRDNGEESWIKTFKALKSHICTENQYYYLGRIDLQIMKNFYISHREKFITNKDIQELENSIKSRWSESNSFGKKVISEWKSLKNILMIDLENN